MTAHRWWSCSGIVFATMILASCTQGQVAQVMGNTTQDMISGPCPPGSGPVSATPEFCVYVTELRVVNHDTEADVSATIVNRTGRRVYLRMESWPSLTDSSGTKWGFSNITGIQYGGGTPQPQPLEPNVDSQVAYSFKRSGSGEVAADLTFSMHGELAIVKADSRGELVPGNQRQAVRGFNFSGLRPVQQQPGQPLQQKSSNASPQPAVQKMHPTPQAATAGPLMKAEKTSSELVGNAPTSKSGAKPVGDGGSGPDVVGLRIGMTPDEARAIFKSRISVTEELRLNENKATLAFLLPGSLSQAVPNSDFIAIMWVQGKGKDGLMRSVRVNLAPVPGHEEIVSVYRMEPIEASKKITFDAFEKLLIEKYGGPPTYTPPGNTLLYWIYGKDGSLLKPGTKSFTAECVQADQRMQNAGVLDLDNDSKMRLAPSFKQLAAQCGATYLSLGMQFDGGVYAGPGTLVNGYLTHLIGFEAASRAANDSNAIIEKAQADASAAAIKKGQQQKPDL